MFLVGDGNASSEFVCPQCGRRYKYDWNLKQHLKYKCGKEPQFKCPVCPERRTNKFSLKNHARTKHGLELT